MKMTNEDIALLEMQDEDTLIQWWHELNVWKWPEGLPNPEDPPPVPQKGEKMNLGRRGDAMDWIDCKVGEKTIIRKLNPGMNDADFEAFWVRCKEI